MRSLTRRERVNPNTWPGFVDALATLLMVIIFLLLVFVLAQFFLSEALSGRDTALRRLQGQVDELAGLLALERKASEDLTANITRLSAELQASVAGRDDLATRLRALDDRAVAAETRAEAQTRDLTRLAAELDAVRALKAELERDAAALAIKVDAAERSRGESETTLIRERELSESARAQIALLNQQTAALREQIERLNTALAASELRDQDQKAQIASLGSRLNAALASKVQELSRYRSEFFGKLREVLGDRPDIRIVGDRFVFQSEVLFATASAELGDDGRTQLIQVAETLKTVSARFPPDIDWVLRVDGHTDRRPIATLEFPSNWELSTARAISVVRLLIDQGIPPHRLAAAGFGEFHPLEDRGDEIAFRRNRRIELKLTER
ncbi:MAG: peptidoglycan -binding protein [Rhodospirillales bacterium]